MDEKTLQQLLAAKLSTTHLHVEGDGYHFMVTVVSTEFEGLRSVQRQQIIYGILNAEITSGTLHALTIKAYTPAEWQHNKEQ